MSRNDFCPTIHLPLLTSTNQTFIMFNGIARYGFTLWVISFVSFMSMFCTSLSFSTLSFGHCVVCSSVCWPLCCLFFCLLAIVLSVLLSFGHCVVCSSIYGFWLPLWYLQTLLVIVCDMFDAVIYISHNLAATIVNFRNPSWPGITVQHDNARLYTEPETWTFFSTL